MKPDKATYAFKTEQNIFPREPTLVNYETLFKITHFGFWLKNSTIMATATRLPFGSWLLRSYFAGIPLELEDAALVDGATRFQAMYHFGRLLCDAPTIHQGVFQYIGRLCVSLGLARQTPTKIVLFLRRGMTCVMPNIRECQQFEIHPPTIACLTKFIPFHILM